MKSRIIYLFPTIIFFCVMSSFAQSDFYIMRAIKELQEGNFQAFEESFSKLELEPELRLTRKLDLVVLAGKLELARNIIEKETLTGEVEKLYAAIIERLSGKILVDENGLREDENSESIKREPPPSLLRLEKSTDPAVAELARLLVKRDRLENEPYAGILKNVFSSSSLEDNSLSRLSSFFSSKKYSRYWLLSLAAARVLEDGGRKREAAQLVENLMEESENGLREPLSGYASRLNPDSPSKKFQSGYDILDMDSSIFIPAGQQGWRFLPDDTSGINLLMEKDSVECIIRIDISKSRKKEAGCRQMRTRGEGEKGPDTQPVFIENPSKEKNLTGIASLGDAILTFREQKGMVDRQKVRELVASMRHVDFLTFPDTILMASSRHGFGIVLEKVKSFSVLDEDERIIYAITLENGSVRLEVRTSPGSEILTVRGSQQEILRSGKRIFGVEHDNRRGGIKLSTDFNGREYSIEIRTKDQNPRIPTLLF